MYFIKVMNGLYNPTRLIAPRYKHFESIQGTFYNSLGKYRLTSTNGFAIDPSKFMLQEDYRISRFVRDPRDLIISGYFYHLRGAEPWFRFNQPDSKYWEPINGNIPQGMPENTSYSAYLQSLSKQEGLIAEIQFRKYHLESIREWPDDERIRVFKYESILGNEEKSFDELFRFFEVTPIERKIGVALARKHKYNPARKSKHIRNAMPGQWKEHFTPAVEKYFNDHYGDLLELLGYD